MNYIGSPQSHKKSPQRIINQYYHQFYQSRRKKSQNLNIKKQQQSQTIVFDIKYSGEDVSNRNSPLKSNNFYSTIDAQSKNKNSTLMFSHKKNAKTIDFALIKKKQFKEKTILKNNSLILYLPKKYTNNLTESEYLNKTFSTQKQKINTRFEHFPSKNNLKMETSKKIQISRKTSNQKIKYDTIKNSPSFTEQNLKSIQRKNNIIQCQQFHPSISLKDLPSIVIQSNRNLSPKRPNIQMIDIIRRNSPTSSSKKIIKQTWEDYQNQHKSYQNEHKSYQKQHKSYQNQHKSYQNQHRRIAKNKETINFNISNKNGLFKPTLEMKRRPSTGIPLKKYKNTLIRQKSYIKNDKQMPQSRKFLSAKMQISQIFLSKKKQISIRYGQRGQSQKLKDFFFPSSNKIQPMQQMINPLLNIHLKSNKLTQQGKKLIIKRGKPKWFKQQEQFLPWNSIQRQTDEIYPQFK